MERYWDARKPVFLYLEAKMPAFLIPRLQKTMKPNN